MGIDYVDMTNEEFKEELCNVERAKEKAKGTSNVYSCQRNERSK